MAPSPDDPRQTVQLELRSDTLQRYQQRAMFTPIAEYYAIVRDLMSAQNCFRGVKRPMADHTGMDIDQRVVVYTWRPLYGAVWMGVPPTGTVIQKVAPPGYVFAVLVRQDDDGQDVYGSIERWNWIEEDPGLPQAPIDWVARYGEKKWSLT